MLSNPTMKIVSLEKVGEPFVGIVEQDDVFVSFIFSAANGGYHELSIYPKSDYPSYEHFIAYICNFKSHGICLKDPIEVKSITKQELYRVYKKIRL